MEAVKPKKTLVEETYNKLVDAICTGEILPGVRLNQDEIADQLGVSRQPVNSAISILRANGLVEDTGRRSVVVSRFDPDLFRSIFEYRRMIEPYAVRLAGPRLKAGQKQEAERVLHIGDKAIKHGNLAGLLHADMLFHQMIYNWSGNLVIQNSMRTNWHHIRRSMAEVLRLPSVPSPLWNEHREIIEALFAGDTEAAAQKMQSHIDQAYKTLVHALSCEKSRES
ncbi:MAG: GntR family transcriptional regulator [Yoonia sp.]|uniref:GntR family transcriptional regulator n=1 Tax=Yoonia sp. TaxID=2212373 RepID=UPI003EF39A45